MMKCSDLLQCGCRGITLISLLSWKIWTILKCLVKVEVVASFLCTCIQPQVYRIFSSCPKQLFNNKYSEFILYV